MYLNNSKYSSRMVQLRKECEERIGESTEAALLEALSAAKPTIGKFRSRRKNKKNSKLRPPGVAESIDWAMALTALERDELDERSVDLTLGTVVKYQEDQERIRGKGIGELVQAALLRGAG